MLNPSYLHGFLNKAGFIVGRNDMKTDLKIFAIMNHLIRLDFVTSSKNLRFTFLWKFLKFNNMFEKCRT